MGATQQVLATIGATNFVYDAALVPPVIEMAVPQSTYPPELDASFDVSTLTTDNVRLEVSTALAFSSLMINQAIVVGAGSQSFTGLSAISSGKQFYRERIERVSGLITYYGAWSNVVAHGDTVAPVLSLPTATQTGAFTADIGVTSDEAEGTLYWSVVLAASAAPVAADFLNGTTGGADTGSTNSPLAGVNPFGATGLAESTSYKAYFFQQDLGSNNSNVAASATFTTADVTAPVLSSPSGVASGSTGADLSVSTNEGNGTLYWYVSTSATPPSLSNLKSGSGSVTFGNQSVSGTGTQNASASGLTASTTYYAYFAQTDASGNDSSIAASAGFTTAASTPVVYATGAAGNNSFNPNITFTGITTTSDKQVVMFEMASGGAEPTAMTLGGDSMTKRAALQTGARNISVWDVVPSSPGAGKSLVATHAGVGSANFDMWTCPTTSTYSSNQSLAYGYNGNPIATAGVTITAGGFAVIGFQSETSTATVAPNTGVTEDAERAESTNARYWAGHMTATGTPSVDQTPAGQGSMLLAAVYAP